MSVHFVLLFTPSFIVWFRLYIFVPWSYLNYYLYIRCIIYIIYIIYTLQDFTSFVKLSFVEHNLNT